LEIAILWPDYQGNNLLKVEKMGKRARKYGARNIEC
jgi:hypothetical protein